MDRITTNDGIVNLLNIGSNNVNEDELKRIIADDNTELIILPDNFKNTPILTGLNIRDSITVATESEYKDACGSLTGGYYAPIASDLIGYLSFYATAYFEFSKQKENFKEKLLRTPSKGNKANTPQASPLPHEYASSSISAIAEGSNILSCPLSLSESSFDISQNQEKDSSVHEEEVLNNLDKLFTDKDLLSKSKIDKANEYSQLDLKINELKSNLSPILSAHKKQTKATQMNVSSITQEYKDSSVKQKELETTLNNLNIELNTLDNQISESITKFNELIPPQKEEPVVNAENYKEKIEKYSLNKITDRDMVLSNIEFSKSVLDNIKFKASNSYKNFINLIQNSASKAALTAKPYLIRTSVDKSNECLNNLSKCLNEKTEFDKEAS